MKKSKSIKSPPKQRFTHYIINKATDKKILYNKISTVYICQICAQRFVKPDSIDMEEMHSLLGIHIGLHSKPASDPELVLSQYRIVKEDSNTNRGAGIYSSESFPSIKTPFLDTVLRCGPFLSECLTVDECAAFHVSSFSGV